MEWELRKFISPDVQFGVGARSLVGQYARKLHGKLALIVTYPDVIEAGWVKNVQDNLAAEGVDSVVYPDVTPNAKDREVMGGAEVYKSSGCNMIIAVGGGSVIDCAKGIGVVSTNNGQIQDFYGDDKVRIPIPKLITVQTTAGTGVSVTRYAMISDTKHKAKMSVDSPLIIPVAALEDPEMAVTMDNYATVCSGADAITQALEGFVSKTHSPITDLLAIQAVGETMEYLPRVIERTQDVDLRGHMTLANISGGLVTSNASVGLVHSISHAIGGLYDLTHGEINMALLEYVVEYNFEDAMERYRQIAYYMGIDSDSMPPILIKQEIINAIREFRNNIGLTKSLSELGVQRQDFAFLARNALNDFALGSNPKKPSQKDIESICEQAY